jgi:hypothetical protein
MRQGLSYQRRVAVSSAQRCASQAAGQQKRWPIIAAAAQSNERSLPAPGSAPPPRPDPITDPLLLRLLAGDGSLDGVDGLSMLRRGIINPQRNGLYRAWWGLLIGAAAFTGIFVPWELGFASLDSLYDTQHNVAAWIDLTLVALFMSDIGGCLETRAALRTDAAAGAVSAPGCHDCGLTLTRGLTACLRATTVLPTAHTAVSHFVAYEDDEAMVDEPDAIAANYRCVAV